MNQAVETPEWLKDAKFSFQVYQADQSIFTLTDPREFYAALLNEIDGAKGRIYLSSLYLGNSHLEKDLVKKIFQRLKQNDNVVFRGIFDYCRGLRGGLPKNTAGMFLPVLSSYPSRSSLYLFRSPFFSGLKNLIPQRWNEIFSVHHMKIYVFDNTVILSGANLSDSYFTNRQDRYVVIRNCSALANFCCDVVDTLGSLSFSVCGDGSVKPTNRQLVDPSDSVWLQKQGNITLRGLLDSYAKKYAPGKNGDAVIFPFLQSAPLGIRDEEAVTELMVKSLKLSDSLIVSTSYFNLTKNYQKLLLSNRRPENVTIYVSSPRSNGFFNGSGLSKYIPHAYTHFSKKFNDKVVKTEQENRILLYEYERDGWSFHSKGIWLNRFENNRSLPYASFIGSTNFSFRSVNRDQEAQFILVTTNAKVKSRLQQEVDEMRGWCLRLDKAALRRTDHAVARWVPLASKIARYFC